MTGLPAEDQLDDGMTAEAREYQAWQQMAALNQQHGIGDEIYDEEFAQMRSEL